MAVTCFLSYFMFYLYFSVGNSIEEKRMLLQVDPDIAADIAQMKLDINQLKSENSLLMTEVTRMRTENADLKATVDNVNAKLQLSKGSTYVHWGKPDCPGNGSDLIYRGHVGGSKYDQTGGGANNLCLPEHPTWSNFTDVLDEWRGRVYGTEYEGTHVDSMNNIGYAIMSQDVSCAVCGSTRINIMLPGRADCFPGWTMEYKGYLMSQCYKWPSNSDYICVDGKPEFVPHGEANHDDHLLYFVESRCGALPCPPYVDGRELACVVCSI